MARSEMNWALVLIAGTALAQTIPKKAPDATEQATALRMIREYALNYSQQLPDYTCTQVTRRTTTPVRVGFGIRGSQSDLIEEQVNFVDHSEIHKVTKINGNPVSNVDHDQLSGGVSRGEFGNLIEIIFAPETASEFRFDRLASLNGRRVYVFDFSVPQARGYLLAGSKGTNLVPYKGSVYADYQNQAVLRIVMKCIDIPATSEIKALDLTLDYKPAKVAGQEFTLPSHYLLRYRIAELDATNEAEYGSYRRFSADATIKFDDTQ